MILAKWLERDYIQNRFENESSLHSAGGVLMTGQITGLMPLTGAEKAQRSPVSGESSSTKKELLNNLQSGVDSTSLSPAALALAKNVPPAGESTEQGKTGQDESEKVAKKSLDKRIDIRV
jgi:hypothetical protein